MMKRIRKELRLTPGQIKALAPMFEEAKARYLPKRRFVVLSEPFSADTNPRGNVLLFTVISDKEARRLSRAMKGKKAGAK